MWIERKILPTLNSKYVVRVINLFNLSSVVVVIAITILAVLSFLKGLLSDAKYGSASLLIIPATVLDVSRNVRIRMEEID